MKLLSRRKDSRFILVSSLAHALSPVLIGAALLAGAGQLAAQTSTGWLGDAATADWSQPGNWTSGIPGNSIQELRFGVAFAANPAGANSLIANNDLAGFTGTALVFENSAGAMGFTITGNGFTLAAVGANAPSLRNESALLRVPQE